MEIRKARIEDKEQMLALYKKVSLVPDGIIRNFDEVNESYILQFLTASISKGLILVGIMENKIIGEIHAITPNIYAFQHIMTDLTIVIDQDMQGQGIGKRIFKQFLNIIQTDFTNILRVELFTREHNERNVKFYENIGFINEGRQQNKIYLSKNSFHTPIHMAWFNPNYDRS